MSLFLTAVLFPDDAAMTVGDNAIKQIKASVLETDKRNDLALLRISSTQMASVETKSLTSKLGLKLVPIASEGFFQLVCLRIEVD
tara:strand:+ start:472 stop:726 length:255 start_codon:yes stop_codon:yes gene_type:complete